MPATQRPGSRKVRSYKTYVTAQILRIRGKVDTLPTQPTTVQSAVHHVSTIPGLEEMYRADDQPDLFVAMAG